MTAPTKSAGTYVYSAEIDKNNDGDFSDLGERTIAILKVLGWGWGTFNNIISETQR